MFGRNNTKNQADLEIFVIYDSKVNAYRDPAFAVNTEVLCRTLITEFCNPRMQQTDMFQNAEDFTVFKTGTYDQKTGTISIHEKESVARVHELKTLALHRMNAEQATQEKMNQMVQTAPQKLPEQPELTTENSQH